MYSHRERGGFFSFFFSKKSKKNRVDNISLVGGCGLITHVLHYYIYCIILLCCTKEKPYKYIHLQVPTESSYNNSRSSTQ